MQRCDYCGRENQAEAPFCAGCGTPFPRPLEMVSRLELEQAPPPVGQPPLNAAKATIILLIYAAAQFIASVAVGAVGALFAVANGKHLENQKELLAFTKLITPIAIPFSVLGGGAGTIVASMLLVRHHLQDSSPSGAAWRVGSIKAVSQGLWLGFAAGVTYAAFGIATSAIGSPHRKLGPLATMAMTPGLPRILWVISLLLLAPPIEELLFRGILYGGYRKSLGHVKAAIFSTAIFSFLHIGEWIHFVPGLVGVTGMGILALWLRLRSGAIGPAIAAHFGYNAILAILLSLFMIFSNSR